MDTRPSRDWVLMESAGLWAQRSTCSRAHVGCVISLGGRILTNGYNGAPTGVPHCSHECTCRASLGKQPDHFSYCPTVSPCLDAVHAEANAIAFAARCGVRIDGAELHTTRSPCLPCAQLIINSGIQRVVYRENYRDMSGIELVASSAIEVVEFKHD